MPDWLCLFAPATIGFASPPRESNGPERTGRKPIPYPRGVPGGGGIFWYNDPQSGTQENFGKAVCLFLFIIFSISLNVVCMLADRPRRKDFPRHCARHEVDRPSQKRPDPVDEFASAVGDLRFARAPSLEPLDLLGLEGNHVALRQHRLRRLNSDT